MGELICSPQELRTSFKSTIHIKYGILDSCILVLLWFTECFPPFFTEEISAWRNPNVSISYLLEDHAEHIEPFNFYMFQLQSVSEWLVRGQGWQLSNLSQESPIRKRSLTRRSAYKSQQQTIHFNHHLANCFLTYWLIIGLGWWFGFLGSPHERNCVT